MRRWLALLLTVIAATPMALADNLRQPEPYRLEAKDWPCEQPYRAELPLGLAWNRPELLQDVPDWRAEPSLRQLVETVTAFDSPTERSVEAITAFAAALPPDPAARARELATLYQGLLEEANFYRELVQTGILQFMAQERLAADLVAESELAFQTTASDDATSLKTIENQHFWATRAVDRAQGEARFQCGRLAAIDGRFARMAAAVEQGLGG
jgi:hypothetical protein